MSHSNIVDISDSTPLLVGSKTNGSLINSNDVHHNESSRRSSTSCVYRHQRCISETETTAHFKILPRRNKYVLVMCTVAVFLSGCAFSLIGPFYPQEAERKGVPVTLVGLVFGMFEGTIFLTSPVFGNYLSHLGPKFVYVSGIFVGGVATILFGTLDKCPSGTSFIVTSALCRFVQAVGFSGFTTASFAIVSSEFSETVGFAFGILETGSGIGFMIGPTIGGALYQVGGFGFPFYIIGALVLANGIFIYKFLPKPQNVPVTKKGSAFSLLRSGLVVIPTFSAIVAFFGITSYDSSFARHLETFNLAPYLIGLFFAIAASIYSIMAPLWGFISDKKDIQAPLIIAGHLVYGLGFLITGPSPVLPFIPFELWALAVGPVFIGISFGAVLIPSMKSMIKGAHELGFESGFDTLALVSGLFNSVTCLGGFLGPIVTSAILQRYDYPIAYTVIGIMNIFMCIVSLVYFSIRHFRIKRVTSAAKSECVDLEQSRSEHDVDKRVHGGSPL